jgi:hypothetical protein
MKIQKTRKRQVKREQVKELLRDLRYTNISYYKTNSIQDEKTTSSSSKKTNITPISSLVETKVENNLSLMSDQKTLDEFKLFQEYLKMKNSQPEVKSEPQEQKFEVQEETNTQDYEDEFQEEVDEDKESIE